MSFYTDALRPQCKSRLAVRPQEARQLLRFCKIFLVLFVAILSNGFLAVPVVAQQDSQTLSAAEPDPASKLLATIPNDIPTKKEILSVLRFFVKMQGYEEIFDPNLRDLLKKKAGLEFVGNTVADIFIDLLIEEMEKNGYFEKSWTIGGNLDFRDKYVFKSFLMTAKNMFFLRLDNQIIDQIFLFTESWSETVTELDCLPPKEELSTDVQRYMKEVYALKSLVDRVRGQRDCVRGVAKYPSGSDGLGTALVIDRSGSMRGEKLRKAKAGAGAYVKLLEPGDYASVSSFSQDARTDMPMSSQAVAGKQIDAVLDTIDSTTSTNIGAGLEQGYTQLDGHAASGRKVGLLLSDGMHNVGSFENAVQPVVQEYASHQPSWRIYAIGYGSDADPSTLQDRIALPTGGRYWHAETIDIEDVYCQINFDVYNKAVIHSVSNPLPPGAELTHVVHVAPGAESLTLCTSHQGSKLETVLVSPTGILLGKERLSGRIGRYDEGATYQLLQVYRPSPGRWQVRVRWAEPPSTPEQVNLTVGEKSDVFAQILGLKSEYQPGEPVTINVEVAEVVGYERVSLLDPSVRVEVQKPGGPQVTQVILGRPVNLPMAKTALQNATSSLRLFDDGAHDDYHPGDGIYGGVFTETDENGAYLVTANVAGHKRNGQRVQKRLIASFQVGPITENPVTTAEILEVRDLLEGRTDPAEAIEALRGDPLENIKGLRQ